MKIKRKQITVTVQRTVQLAQYHPATVTVTETAEVGPDDDHKEIKIALYKSATAAVTKFLKAEVRAHGTD